MKKICFINPSSIFGDIGGAEVQIYILAMQMVQKNWSVFYLTAPNQIPEKNETGIQFVPIQETGNIKKDAELFINKLDKINPDFIYQRGRKLWTHYTGEYCKSTGCKFIFSASMDIDCYKHKFLFRTPNTLRELYARLKKWKYNAKLDDLTLKSMMSADLVLSQTVTQKELLEKNLRIESTIFPNIHPLPEEVTSSNKNSKPVVLWLARFRPWKQPEVFMKLATACKKLDCEFVMAGRLSNKRYEDQLRQMENENPNFKYIGSLPFHETNTLLKNVDLLVNTSKQEEGFPNTYVQAWLRKVPVITLNFDPDNIIQKNSLGAITYNFKKLVLTTTKFVKESDYRRKVGENAYHYAVKRHSVDNKINDFVELVEKEGSF